MSLEDNKNIVRRYQDAFNANKLDALDALVTADLITHSQMPGVPPGLAGGKLVHQQLLKMFPDLLTHTEELMAEGDKVMQRFSVSGTDKGGFMGAPPTGKAYKVPGVSIFRMANGKIVEHWGILDQLSILQQLGMMPAPAASR